MKYRANMKNLKKAMLEKNISYREFAQYNVSTATITKLFKGGDVRATTANKIAKALNVPVTELFE